MARASWGNVGVDYSSFFSDLYRSGENKKKADQRAADNAAAAAWAAGEMDSDAWLAYIAQRLAATTDDAEENAYWRQRKIEDTRYVEDSRAEEAYTAAGSTGLAAYLEYNKGVLAEMNPGSKAYSDRQTLVYRLQDELDQNNYTKLANAATERLNAGDPTAWADLVKIWTEAKSSVRAGSSFMDTIDTQLAAAKLGQRDYRAQTLEGDATVAWNSGKLNGRQYAAKLRAIANTYYKSNPQKYYELLNNAAKFNAIGSGTVNSGGGSGGSGGGGISTGSAMAIALAKANVDNALALETRIAAAGNNPNATIDGVRIFDAQGNYASWVDDFRANTLVAYDNYAYQKGKSSKASDQNDVGDIEGQKQNYIFNNVQPTNTVVGDLLGNRLLSSFQTQFKIASDNSPDPNAAMAVARGFYNAVGRWIKKYTVQSDIAPVPGEVRPTQLVGPTGQVSADSMAGMVGLYNLLGAAINGEGDWDDIAAAITGQFPNVSSSSPFKNTTLLDSLKSVHGTASSANCLNAGTCALVQYPSPEKPGQVDTTVVQYTNGLGGQTLDPLTMGTLKANTGAVGWRVVKMKVNGQFQDFLTAETPLQVGTAWQAQKAFGQFKKGDWIPANFVEDGRAKGWAMSGLVAEAPVYASGYVRVDVGGVNGVKPSSWVYADRADSPAWPLDHPPFSVSLLPDGTVAVGTDGSFTMPPDPRSGRWSVPGAVGGTNDPNDTQTLVDSGAFAGVKNVNENGEFVDVTDGWRENLKTPAQRMSVANPRDRDTPWLDDAVVKERKNEAARAAQRATSDPREYEGKNDITALGTLAEQMGIKGMSISTSRQTGPGRRETFSGQAVTPTIGSAFGIKTIGEDRTVRSSIDLAPARPVALSGPSVSGVPKITSPKLPTATLPSARDTSWTPPKADSPKITVPRGGTSKNEKKRPMKGKLVRERL